LGKGWQEPLGRAIIPGQGATLQRMQDEHCMPTPWVSL
jgi:hypothetical protein